MTSNRFVKGEPSATKIERVDAKQPKFCEIPGCKTRWVPPPLGSSGNGHYACGGADVLVNDRFGIKRGICGAHYLRGLVDDGKMPNQHLVDRDGRIDPTKVRAHWDSIAQLEIAETAKRQRRMERDA